MTNTRLDRLLIPALVTALAWWYLLHGAGMPPAMPGMDAMPGMSAMTDGMSDPGTLFVMWSVMMVAMMLPGAAPWIAARGAPFATGYLLVWVAFGAVAALVQWQLERAGALSATMALRSAPLAALVVAAAGVYELMPLKRVYLRRCRPDDRAPATPTAGMTRAGIASAVESGVRQGLFCVGCCWALMALLFVTGVMNVAWMVAITLLVAAEKLLPFRVHVVAGAALVLCVAA